MKAAIIVEAGRGPIYGDFREPISADEATLITVTAAALSHVTKSRASGTHYSSPEGIPFVVGVDGVGRDKDGRRLYFLLPEAPFGSMAERTLVQASQCIPLLDGLSDVTAAAIAIPGMSSWAALTERAKLVAGETVLINGATGTSGRLAVQIAKHLGAKRVIATGRSAEALQSLTALGADGIISLVQDGDVLEDAFKEQFGDGVNVVLDYLWGQSAERLMIAAAKAGKDATPIRFVHIGSVSASTITLPSAVLRSSALELMGSGIGSIPLNRIMKAIKDLLRATVSVGFEIATEAVPLMDVAAAWGMEDTRARTVFLIGERENPSST
jgi:NADPH:quinone reductase-like Zn-dependent oxidoreductase